VWKELSTFFVSYFPPEAIFVSLGHWKMWGNIIKYWLSLISCHWWQCIKPIHFETFIDWNYWLPYWLKFWQFYCFVWTVCFNCNYIAVCHYLNKRIVLYWIVVCWRNKGIVSYCIVSKSIVLNLIVWLFSLNLIIFINLKNYENVSICIFYSLLMKYF